MTLASVRCQQGQTDVNYGELYFSIVMWAALVSIGIVMLNVLDVALSAGARHCSNNREE